VSVGRRLRLDAGDRHAAREPRRHAADEAATTDRDEDAVQAGRLLLEFQAQRALPLQGFPLVVRVDGLRARIRDEAFARQQRVVVALAPHDQLRAVAADLLDLRG
jgi:hypothetical protein